MPKRKAAAQAPAQPATPDYKSLTVAQLKKLLSDKKLPQSGSKAQLIERLEGAACDAAATDSKAPPAKKAKKPAAKAAEPESATSKAVASLQSVADGATAIKKKKKKSSPKVDPFVYGGYEVVDDYACMLNQTNIGHNNNKYYVIQLLKRTGTFGQHSPYNVFTRWGRVGESGDNKYLGPFRTLEDAEKEYCKKFSAKTSNQWKNRDKFVPKSGKYTLLEMDDDSDDDQAGRLASMDKTDGPIAVKKTAECKLDSSTQKLVKFIFDEDMFKEAMQGLEIDTKKLPLGKLSKVQVLEGFKVLEQIEKKLNGEKMTQSLQDLSSLFYTRIPHDFGRKRPPVISNKEVLQAKMDMLMVLADIEMAQTMQASNVKKEEVSEVPHPLDEKYAQLKAKLTVLPKSSPTFPVLETYLKSTQGFRNLEIQDIFEVDRENADERFAAHDSLKNRRLLWHGTNVAVVAAILKTGLRIMPHSGGRVGKGMYFASENSKSANYVRCARSTGIMFLVEVALGEEHHISHDDWTLTKAPAGKDCIIAKGRTEPDPTKDSKLKLAGKEVVVPQGAPLQQGAWASSSFSQSEYLVYKESQARIRYMFKLKF